MKTLEIIKKIAELLWNNGCKGMVWFDHSSYDNDEDIPSLTISNDKIKIETFVIDKEATRLSVQTRDGEYSLSLVPTGKQTLDNIESILNESGVPDLLRDVYYETDSSYEIGDYELDFLKNL